MKKSIIALAVCMMLILASLNVYAAVGTVYYDLGETIEITDRTADITVPLNMSFSDDIAIVGGTNGIGMLQINIVYDSSVLTYAGIEGTDYENWKGGTTEEMIDDEYISANAVGNEFAVAGSDTLKRFAITMLRTQGAMTAKNSFYEEGNILNLKFTVNADYQGATEEKVTNIYFSEDATSACKTKYTDNSEANTSVTGGDVDVVLKGSGPVKPETTVVKTFPKRFYAGEALTTVGVILEGQDFDNATAVKAGVNAKRVDGKILDFASAPIASNTDAAKSYVMVTLGEITEEKTFKPTTPTRAYVDLDGVAIYGDFVTENATDATDVETDADFED